MSANELLSLQKQLKNLKVDLKDNEVPYVVKFKALKDLEALDKKINISIRENERYTMLLNQMKYSALNCD